MRLRLLLPLILAGLAGSVLAAPAAEPCPPGRPTPFRGQVREVAPLFPVLVDAPKAKVFPRGAKPSPRKVISDAKKFQSLHTTPPQYVNIPTWLSMWGNDQYGNCTGAETFFARSASAGLKGTDGEAITFSRSAGVLDGGVISAVLDFEASNGTVIGGKTYKSGPKQSVDYTNQTVLFSAITQGPIKVGIDSSILPSGAGNQQGWIVTGAPVSSNYDHCMSLTGCGTMAYLAKQMNVTLPAGYDGTKSGVLAYTWATVGIIDLDSIENAVCEAWLRTPTTVGFAPPSAITLTVTPTTGNVPLAVTFTSTVPAAWTLNFGDGSAVQSGTSAGAISVPHTYATAGTFTAALTSGTQTATVVAQPVGPPPPNPPAATTITVNGALTAGTYQIVPSGSVTITGSMTLTELMAALQKAAQNPVPLKP